MLEIGSKIEIKQFDITGEIVESDKTSVLVKYFAKIDGQTKVVNQWYDKELCTEIK